MKKGWLVSRAGSLTQSNALNMGAEKQTNKQSIRTGKGATKVTLKFSPLIVALSPLYQLVEIRLKTKHCANFHLGTVTHCLNF